MEEELNYATINFIKRDAATQEKEQEVVYDEVKTQADRRDTQQVVTEQDKKAARRCPLGLTLSCLGLGLACLILIAINVALSLHIESVKSEQNVVNDNLTQQIHLLLTERTRLQDVLGEVTSQGERLNKTMGFILEFDSFPVSSFCSNKVCRPCQDGWKLFQSKCYLFPTSGWRSWAEAQAFCQPFNAQLAVINSAEEQEFISKQGPYYYDKYHGYWIGLKKAADKWTWVDGSQTTVNYWSEEPKTREGCLLLLPSSPREANWKMVTCDMYNRGICESKALITPEEESGLKDLNL